MTRSDARARLAVFLAAAALRPELVVVGPLVLLVSSDLSLSHPAAGLLVSIPLLGMGLFAPVGADLARHIDARRLLAASLGVVAAFGFVRAVAPDGFTMLAATLPIAAAMGIAGSVLPILVKERSGPRIAGPGVAYSFGIQIGSALTPLLAIAVIAAGYGWRTAFAAVAVLVVALTLGWLGLTRPVHATSAPGPGWRAALHSRTGWLLAGAYSILSVLFYGIVAWLPLAYQERGWDLGSSAALLTWLTLSGLAATLLTPRLSRTRWGARGAVLGASVVGIVGSAGLCIAPMLAVPWTVLLGFEIGVVFTITLAVPLAVARDPNQAGQITALMLLVGYLLAAASPVGLALLRDVLGSFSSSLWVLLAVAVFLPAFLWVSVPGPRANVST